MYGYDTFSDFDMARAGFAAGAFGFLMLISLVASVVLTVLAYLKFARNPGEKLFDFATKDGFIPFLRFDTFLLERLLKILYMFTALMFAFTNLSIGISSLFADFIAGFFTLLFMIVATVFGEVFIRMGFEGVMLRVVIARNTTQIKQAMGVDLGTSPATGAQGPAGGVGAHAAGRAPVARPQLAMPQPPHAGQYKHCPTCGARLAADAHFCGTCGTRM